MNFNLKVILLFTTIQNLVQSPNYFEKEAVKLNNADYFLTFKHELALGPNKSFNYTISSWIRLPSNLDELAFFNIFLDNLKFFICDYKPLAAANKISSPDDNVFLLELKNSNLYKNWFYLGLNISQSDTGFEINFWDNGVITKAEGEFYFPDIKLLTLVFCTDVKADNSLCKRLNIIF